MKEVAMSNEGVSAAATVKGMVDNDLNCPPGPGLFKIQFAQVSV
jgi:hypothetical protein